CRRDQQLTTLGDLGEAVREVERCFGLLRAFYGWGGKLPTRAGAVNCFNRKVWPLPVPLARLTTLLSSVDNLQAVLNRLTPNHSIAQHVATVGGGHSVP